MATNLVFEEARKLLLTWTTADSTGGDSDFTSGSPIMVGKLPGTVLVDSSSNQASVDVGGAYRHTVVRPTTAITGQFGSVVFWKAATRQPHLGSTVATLTTANPVFGVLLSAIAVGTSLSTGATIKIGAFSPT